MIYAKKINGFRRYNAFIFSVVSAIIFMAMLLDPANASKPTVPWTINVSAEETAKNEVTVLAVLHSDVAVENMSFRINHLQGDFLRGEESWRGSIDSSDKIRLEAVFSNENMPNAQWAVLSNGRVESVEMGKLVEVHLKNNFAVQKARHEKQINIKAGAEEYPAFPQ